MHNFTARLERNSLPLKFKVQAEIAKLSYMMLHVSGKHLIEKKIAATAAEDHDFPDFCQLRPGWMGGLTKTYYIYILYIYMYIPSYPIINMTSPY